jgi:alkylhydroperoxidase family enzyme
VTKHKQPKHPRLTKPRVPPVVQSDWNDAQRALLQPVADKGRLWNVHSTLAAHPKMAAAWMPFATYILRDNSLPVRDREILILRIGRLCNAPYELAQHARIGRRAGLTDDDLRHINEGPNSAGLSEHDRLLLTAADELHEDAFITDGTWSALAKAYSTQQLMDLVFTVGEYNLVSMALNSFGVQLDADLDPFPE